MSFGGPGYPESSNPYMNLQPATFSKKTATLKGVAIPMPSVVIPYLYFDWGDGTTSTLKFGSDSIDGYVSWGFEEPHTYAKAGTYKISVSGTDADGNSVKGSEKVVVP
jgi:hypothetical protein